MRSVSGTPIREMIETLPSFVSYWYKVVRALWQKLQPDTDYDHGHHQRRHNLDHKRLRDHSNHLDDDTVDLNEGDGDGDDREE